VRADLEDDEEAFRASVLENTQRKTWSDIDRALVIRSYEDRGHTGREIADELGLTGRQARNIRSLLELPEEAQQAVDDEADKVTATHAITLRQLAGRYPDLDWGRWLGEINTANDGDGLSVAQLKREVNRAHKTASGSKLGSIFRDGATDAAKGVFRLQPVKIEVGVLSDRERAGLRAQLEMMLGALAVG
jgi:ParB-like chromosome segregation protein Spo0J